MGWGRDTETRLDKLERFMVEQIAEARAARANFLMAVNQMGKFKDVVDTHVHTMTDENGTGVTRPQDQVINIVHEMVQVLESEANTLRVDSNAYRDALAGVDQRLTLLEAAVRTLCSRLGQAVDHTSLYKSK